MASLLRSLQQDRSLRGILKNSGYLFSSNTFSAALGMLQGIFAVRLLGVAGYGLFGIITTFATNVNRLLSFRMSEMVVKYMGQYLVEGRRDLAGAVARVAALLEAATSIAAFLVLLALSPLAARILAKDGLTAPLFTFYGLSLLSNLIFESSTGVLQATRRFDRLALANIIQSSFTAVLILAAAVARRGIWEILGAYLVGKTAAGILVAFFAYRSLASTLEPGWLKTPLRSLPDLKGMLRFAFSTNLNGTVNLVVRDSELLLVGALCSTAQAGYYKLAYGLINLVMMPVDPLVGPTYTEITRTIIQREWSATRRLLKRVSGLAAAWTLSAGLGLALLGYWLIPLMYGKGTQPAYPALLLLLLGYGFANIFQWNRPLLLALGRPAYPLTVSAISGAVKTVLSFWLTPSFGYLAEAGILSSYFVASVGINILKGDQELKKQEQAP